jgi:hypothetical protein
VWPLLGATGAVIAGPALLVSAIRGPKRPGAHDERE